MFLYLAILPFCAVVSALPTERDDVVYPTVETFRSGVKRIRFRAFDQNIDLRVEPASEIISDDLAICEGEGSKIENYVDVKNIKRKIYRNEEKRAALLIDDDGPLTIKGIVNTDLKIEPHESEEMAKDGVRAHRVIELKKGEEGRIRTNDAVIIPENIGMNETESERQTVTCIQVELVLILESNYTHFHNNDNNVLISECIIIATEMQNLIESVKLNIQIKLIKIIKFTVDYEASFIEASALEQDRNCLDSSGIIANMKTFYQDKHDQTVNIADLALLITGRRMCDLYSNRVSYGTIGIAYVGGVCSYKYKFGVSEFQHNTFKFHETCAHEVAHLLGSPHDEDDPVSSISRSPGSKDCPWSWGFIMSYLSNWQNGTLFSSCTRANIENLSGLYAARCIKC
ncbi:venom metalloproteinase antarease-like TtrivMP_A [Centruroides sculpturatus]|uniref:venom metalloproteinase antarease-like TtrivMP_A n=1 Tax=Centruroides sculpturatus TaxID=218467 RepID=UPI000C6D4427|nr:venom metalloproteinase antarease-like TtrivMP_A [Centruroides sculpturatus]